MLGRRQKYWHKLANQGQKKSDYLEDFLILHFTTLAGLTYRFLNDMN